MKIKENIALEILNAALATGADYSEIYYQDLSAKATSRKYGKVFGVNSSKSRGVGIRIIKDKSVVYGYTSDLSKKSLLKLASELALGFKGDRGISVDSLVEKKTGNINIIKVPHDARDENYFIDYLKKGEDVAFSYSKEIKDVYSCVGLEDEHVEIYNSKGVFAADDRVRTKVVIDITASDGKKFTEACYIKALSKGLELLDEIDFEAEAMKAAKKAIDKLSAKDAPSGVMPVVLASGFGGVLFHESCGHPLEGQAISHKTSPFSDKLGQKIGTDILNAYDDGTLENHYGSENIDDEGNTPTKNQLIRDGVLVSYMLDDFSCKLLDSKSAPTGCCRRESYRYLPTTRMTNTYIGNGKSKREDIIKSVKRGIYCEEFTGGQVNTTTDQFVFTSDSAYLIEDGKITDMIKPISLIGYGYDIIKKITMIADDLDLASGVCGSSSGSCYVEVGQPTLLIDGILVGGQK